QRLRSQAFTSPSCALGLPRIAWAWAYLRRHHTKRGGVLMHASGARLLVATIAATGLFAMGAGAPLSAAADDEHSRIPIDHVVVLMQENRSFDSYFGELHLEGQPRSTPLPPESSNPNPVDEDAPPIEVFHKTALCEVADVNHSWTGTHQEIDNGRMDG